MAKRSWLSLLPSRQENANELERLAKEVIKKGSGSASSSSKKVYGDGKGGTYTVSTYSSITLGRKWR